MRFPRGLAQGQIAEELGVTVRYSAGLERGERNLSLGSVDVLAEQLDITATLTLEAQ